MRAGDRSDSNSLREGSEVAQQKRRYILTALSSVSKYNLIASLCPTVLGRTTALPSSYVSFSSNLTSIVSNQIVSYGKQSIATTVLSMQAVATSFSCASNPVFTLYDCGTSGTALARLKNSIGDQLL